MRSAVQSTTSLRSAAPNDLPVSVIVAGQTQVLIQVLLMSKSMVLLTWGLK
jgi:hypothetical protein